VALAIWGVTWGVANTAMGALFADSIRDGDRPYFFTQRSILINFGNTVGPTLALILFFVLGDHWTVRDCAIVMTLGQTICLPAIILLSFFNDDESVDRGHTPTSEENDNDNHTATEPLLEVADESLEADSRDSQEQSASVTNPATENSRTCTARQAEETIFCCISKQRLAPVLISIGDLTAGLASGMSIRYFPIFFVDRLKLSPVQVQVLYILTPLMQASLMKLGQYTSQTFGRCQIAVAHKWTGIACMVILVLSAHFGLPAWFICVTFVVRTGFMNSTSPLTKSILMDNVPAKERGRWSVLESVNMFSWSGSAAFGGFLVSFDGLLFNFSVTAALQFLATIPVLILMSTVDVEGTGQNTQRDASTSENNTNALAAPALPSAGETTTTNTDDEGSDESNPHVVRV
jgi:MFS family permease